MESQEEEYKNTLITPPIYSFWHRIRQAFFIILGITLVTAIVYSVTTTIDRNTLKTELAAVQNEFTLTQSELGSIKETLTSTQSDLSSTKKTLASTQTELNSTKQNLASAQVDLSSTKQSLASTQADLSSTKQSLYSTQADLQKAEAKIILFQETFGADVFSGEQPTEITGGSL